MRPVIQMMELSSTGVFLSWTSRSGFAYQLQRSVNGEPFAGLGLPVQSTGP